MAVSVTPVSRGIGVEIAGRSGPELATPQVAAEVREYLDEYGVVIYREARIGDADLVALSRMLGEVIVAPMGGEEGFPEVSAISLDPARSTLAAYRAGTFYWHIDGANDLVPQKATLLTALEVATEGGDTEFANLYAAYEALSAQERATLAELRVVHSFAATQRLSNPDAPAKMRAAWDKVPSREHPLVWTRRSGRKSLLVGATADHVVGLAAEESRALLDRLLAWATQREFSLRHRWRHGDLVVWDNTGILHRAQPYTAASRRLMHRTTLVGEEAVA
ncbi:TauD/TfdA family dioxygenase [Frankia sp. CNm7]|uniref:TauD/TfdA family dioxygenase n=1 Tax=Frankia nepalensis TaxID=1836974 RepID=A0A937RCS9_9ACTN|nr:TauD/TfdA family dioxygenase [Frankia nepalensis]MBL7501639.1 TauD/TfdA family dioxygenase [Frankia nepalensis]MBL7513377.1 TauD/TfdA family dioxygenase [Frankia nepalensis]MBL7523020.1 TauD/TfdA family dioxygenase [Frankia nepalensis]MBL7628070.1 TauD/TfdA family dioxygenase [Frankia nepalensis]